MNTDLIERLGRNRDSLRYVLNWEPSPRTQIGTLYRTFTRYDGEDCSISTKERLEQLYCDTDEAKKALTQADARIARLEEALVDWRNSWLCPCTDFEGEVERLLRITDNLLTGEPK